MTIDTIRETVSRIAKSYPVISVDLFGSFAEDRATEESDIDLLVCFDLKRASLFDLSGFRFDVQDSLHREVDVVAGPLGTNSYLTIQSMVRLYAA